jgi:hypothetical protein
MTAEIDTSNVTGRRQLQFNCIDDMLADVERLAQSKEVRALGNWSGGQVLRHLTIIMNGSIDGVPPMMPGAVRFMIRLLAKRRILSRPMAPGFKLPARAAMLIPPETTWEEGLNEFRRAAGRLKSESARKQHPAFGPLTREEWDRLHCRHAELHLSFLVPVT